ncbi:MAG: beta-phosphoglucomutase-like phosphatase (HAD superfamily) [Lentisphaeria bacterium]|jgi:beta-phosphoglucomutase-like phosphatase (HAD superfamily)
MGIKGVIFDHDGTLVDSERNHFLTWRDLLTRYQVEPGEQGYIFQHAGVPTLCNAELIVLSHQLNISPQALCQQKEALTESFLAKHASELISFVKQCVENCYNAGLSLAIATGASAEEIRRSLAHHNVSRHLTHVATRNHVTRGKPDPEVYSLMLKQMVMSAPECVAIEHSRTGVLAAKAAGLTCTAVPNPYSRQQDLSPADIVVEDLKCTWNETCRL